MFRWSSKSISNDQPDEWQKGMENCMKNLEEHLNKEDAENSLIRSLSTTINLAITFELERSAHLEEAKKIVKQIEEKLQDPNAFKNPKILQEALNTFKNTFENIITNKNIITDKKMKPKK